jgi:hypothetical protein
MGTITVLYIRILLLTDRGDDRPSNQSLYNLISTSGSPSGPFPSGFHTKALYTLLLSTVCATFFLILSPEES